MSYARDTGSIQTICSSPLKGKEGNTFVVDRFFLPIFEEGCWHVLRLTWQRNERNLQRSQKKMKASSRQMAKSTLGLQPCRSPVIVWLGLNLNTYLKLNKTLFGLPCWLRQKRIRLHCGRCGLDPWVGKIPWRRAWQSTLVFLPGESQGQRSLVGYSPWGRKESDTTGQLRTGPRTQGTVWCCINYKATKMLKAQCVNKGSLD